MKCLMIRMIALTVSRINKVPLHNLPSIPPLEWHQTLCTTKSVIHYHCALFPRGVDSRTLFAVETVFANSPPMVLLKTVLTTWIKAVLEVKRAVLAWVFVIVRVIRHVFTDVTCMPMQAAIIISVAAQANVDFVRS